jgi:L-aminopeptidase/D-esterase-like protein
MGYLACTVASQQLWEGSFGAGAGATVGKILGIKGAMKSGVGTASLKLNLINPASGQLYPYTIGVLVVNNAFGDIYQGEQIIAGARSEDHKFVDTSRVLSYISTSGTPPPPTGQNTTLAVVATDVPLNKSACQKIAQMAHDGMARAIRPAHTMFDGDTIFALSTGGLPSTPVVDPYLVTVLGAAAADVLATALVRSITETTPGADLPSASSLKEAAGQ